MRVSVYAKRVEVGLFEDVRGNRVEETKEYIIINI